MHARFGAVNALHLRGAAVAGSRQRNRKDDATICANEPFAYRLRSELLDVLNLQAVHLRSVSRLARLDADRDRRAALTLSPLKTTCASAYACAAHIHNDPSLIGIGASMAAVAQPAAGAPAALPAEVWGVIARAALRAEGDGVCAWERFSRVSRSWRTALAGDHRGS